MFNSIGASEYANETAVPEGRQANEMSAFAEQTKKRNGIRRARPFLFRFKPVVPSTKKGGRMTSFLRSGTRD